MEIDLFVHFAEIAGAFVGFGALISLRSAHVTDLHDVVYLKAVLMLGVWVVVAALVPIAVSRYGVGGHPLWLWSALAGLATWLVVLLAFVTRPETRAINSSTEAVDRWFPLVGAPLHLVIAGSLLLTVLGLWPGADAARYVTALAAAVVFAGYTLLTFVLSQRPDVGPEAGSTPARPDAAGDDERTT